MGEIIMAIDIKINVTGDKQLIQKLNNISTSLARPKKPLQNSSKIMMAAIMQNFGSQGATFKTPWKELSKATIAIKKKENYGDKPPLVRTGRMKGGFRSSIEKNTLIIDNPVPYFIKHQSSNVADRADKTLSGRKMVLSRRVMLRIDRTRLHLVIDAFLDWIVGIIKKK